MNDFASILFMSSNHRLPSLTMVCGFQLLMLPTTHVTFVIGWLACLSMAVKRLVSVSLQAPDLHETGTYAHTLGTVVVVESNFFVVDLNAVPVKAKATYWTDRYLQGRT